MGKSIAAIAGIFLLAAATTFFAFRLHIIRYADHYAAGIFTSNSSFLSSADKAVYVTQKIYGNFYKDGYQRHKLLARLRPYLSNRRLPSFLAVPSGAIELYTMEGWCDDAARALIYILAKEGITAHQWNMQGPHSAHSAAVLILTDGKTVLLDPFYGYTSVNDGKAHDTLSVRNSMHAGKTSEGLLAPFDNKSNKAFYDEFGTMAMGLQGEPLVIPAQIPSTQKRLELGNADGNTLDARAAILHHDMTMTWEYVGHKYDRGWTRELVAQHPLQLDIILTRRPDARILRTFLPTPTVNGTKLSWNLLKGEKIISQDSKAGISPFRLNSYIDVDQIVITPQGEKP